MNSGRRLIEVKITGLMKNSWAFRRLSLGFLSIFFTQVSLKEKGRRLCTKLCINLILLKWMSLSIGRICSVLKSGAVWVLEGTLQIVRIAFFCIMTSLDNEVGVALP